MSIDAKAVVTGETDVLKLLRFIDETYPHATLGVVAHMENEWYYIAFKAGGHARQLSVFPPGNCAGDYAEIWTGPALYVSFGAWGNSEVVLRRILCRFGGFLLANDFDGEWERVAAEVDRGRK